MTEIVPEAGSLGREERKGKGEGAIGLHPSSENLRPWWERSGERSAGWKWRPTEGGPRC